MKVALEKSFSLDLKTSKEMKEIKIKNKKCKNMYSIGYPSLKSVPVKNFITINIRLWKKKSKMKTRFSSMKPRAVREAARKIFLMALLRLDFTLIH